MLKHLFIASALLLAACGEPPQKTVSTYFEQQNYNEAITWLNEQLADDKENRLLNSLLAEALIRQCLKNNCFSKQEGTLDALPQALSLAGQKPIQLEENQTRDTYAIISNLAKNVIKHPDHPKPLVKIMDSLPESAPKNEFIALIMQEAKNEMTHFKPNAAANLLESVAKLVDRNSFTAHYTTFLVGLLTNNQDILNVRMPAMRAKQQEASPNGTDDLKLLPYAMYLGTIQNNPREGTNLFIQNFEKNLDAYGVRPFQTPQSRSQYAQMFKNFASNTQFLNHANRHYQPEQALIPVNAKEDISITQITTAATATVDVESEDLPENDSPLLKTQLLKASLSLDPSQPETWESYLQATSQMLKYSKNPAELFASLDKSKMPASAAGSFNESLFASIEAQIEKEDDTALLPLLKQVIVPADAQEAKKIRVRAEKIITRLMEKAINQQNIEKVIAYTEFNPEVGRLFRQQIVSLVVEKLEANWKQNDFNRIDTLAHFLTSTMDVDFNLDSLILQNFDQHLQNIEINKQLTANSPTTLLQPQNEVALDLGPKFEFLRRHFKNQPEVIDTQLKNLIVNAKGTYGTATALHRLFSQFDESKFPEEERYNYLVSSIKGSLSNDESLSAKEFANIGYRLHKMHPSLPLLFIISESLRRVDSLEDARAIWKTANQEFITSLRTVRPQFTALMEGVDAYEEGDLQTAAERFSILSHPRYLEQVQPYVDEMRLLTKSLEGIYLAHETNDNMRTIMIMIEPSIADMEAERQGKTHEPLGLASMLGLKLQLINAVGSVNIANPKTLSEDRGQTFKSRLQAYFNPNAETITLTEEAKSNIRLPKSFERIYGDITSFHIDDENMQLKVNNDKKTYQFKRIKQKTIVPLQPEGRYGITTQKSKNSRTTDHILPVGSILTLRTDLKNPIQPIKEGLRLPVIFPVSGTLLHPLSPKPLTVEGFYSIDRHTTNLSYTYPYGPQGSKLEANVRCHVIDTYLTCAGHNVHWSRKRYTHVVEGRKAKNSKPAAPEPEKMPTPKEMPATPAMMGQQAPEKTGN